MTSELLSVVLPAYNEGPYLKDCVAEMLGALATLPVACELLICEGSSTDDTRPIADRLAAEHAAVRVVDVPGLGYGKALRVGILAARGTYTTIYNVDHWDVGFARASLEALHTHDVVIGSKTMAGALDERPMARRIITRLFNLVLRVVFQYPGTDTHGMKAGRTAILQKLATRCESVGDLFDTELVLRASRQGARIVEIPVVVQEPRPSRWGIRKRLVSTLRDLWSLGRVMRRVRR